MPMGTENNVSVIDKSETIVYAHTFQGLVESMTILLEYTIFARHYAGNKDFFDFEIERKSLL